MQITESGLKRPEIEEINIESFGENVTILDEHLRNTDIHVNAGKIAEITEPDELAQIDSTDTNSTMWGKIKKSISEVNNHVDKVASDTKLGHIKIGTGLQVSEDGKAKVKIANDLETDDSETALSAAMGAQLSANLEDIKNNLTRNEELKQFFTATSANTRVLNDNDFTKLRNNVIHLQVAIILVGNRDCDTGLFYYSVYTKDDYDSFNLILLTNISTHLTYFAKASTVANNFVTIEAIPAGTYWVTGEIKLK